MQILGKFQTNLRSISQVWGKSQLNLRQLRLAKKFVTFRDYIWVSQSFGSALLIDKIMGWAGGKNRKWICEHNVETCF